MYRAHLLQNMLRCQFSSSGTRLNSLEKAQRHFRTSDTYDDSDQLLSMEEEEVPTKRKPKTSAEILPSDIEHFLRENDMRFTRSHTGYLTTCKRFTKFDVNVQEASLHMNSLYINDKSGFFHCQSCGNIGSFQDFKGILDKQAEYMKMDFSQVPKGAKACPTTKKLPEGKSLDVLEFLSLGWVADEDLNKALHGLNLDGISRETLEHFNARLDGETLILPFWNPVNDTKCSSYASLSPDTERCKIHSSGELRSMFGLNKEMSAAKEIVIVTDLRDALAVYESTGLPVLYAPLNRTKPIPDNVIPLLENIDKITLWEFPSRKSKACKLKRILSARRFYVVKRDKKDSTPFKALQKGDDIGRVLAEESRVAIHGNIASFHDLRDQVYDDIMHRAELSGVKWSRFPKLNQLLKGHRSGELTVFTGPTGSGKTTFISEYSLDLCEKDVSTLWGSFEVNNRKLLRTMLRQFARKNIEEDAEELFDEVANRFEELDMHFMTFHGQENIDHVIDTMTHAAHVNNIKHVIVDNLQFMMGSGQFNAENRFVIQDQILAKFRKFATVRDCHVTLVVHPRKERSEDELTLQSVFGSAKASQEADNVIILQKIPFGNNQFKKYIDVVKNRYEGELGKMFLRFNHEALSFAMDQLEDATQPPISAQARDSGMDKSDHSSLSSNSNLPSDSFHREDLAYEYHNDY